MSCWTKTKELSTNPSQVTTFVDFSEAAQSTSPEGTLGRTSVDFGGFLMTSWPGWLAGLAGQAGWPG